MMKYSCSLYFIIVLLCFAWVSSAAQDTIQQFDCKSTGLNSRVPKFTSLTVFPSPAKVGDIVHTRTIVTIADSVPGFTQGSIQDGTMLMEIRHKDVVVANIPGISLCGSTPSIVCSSLGPGENAISFNYKVPKIPPGEYTVTIQVFPNKTTTNLEDGCLTFDITILDPSADPAKYVSWIRAELAGIAQFEHSNYLTRTLEENIQVGPMGDASPLVSYTYPWGTFISLEGSGDLVAPGLNTAGYVWGLNGKMEEMTYQSTRREHLYRGTFYIGYVTSMARRELDVEILTGRFELTWRLQQGNDGVLISTLTGTISFDDDAVLPLGWGSPITIGRLEPLSVVTSSEGILLVQASEVLCLEDADCDEEEVIEPEDDNSLEPWEIGLLAGILCGVVVLFVLAIALFMWRSHKRRTEEEDGIFSAARKPEYGNALVVDDIIQETREHSPNLMPPLNRNRQGDFSDDESDYSRGSRRSRSRTPDSAYSRSRTPSRSRSRSRSRSMGRSRSDSGSYSDYSDAGSSASRA